LELPPDQCALFLQVARQEKAVEKLDALPPPSTPQARSASEPFKPSLPVSPNPIVGREFELAEIARLVRDPQCRLLTLTGPGGIGKTRLALEAARHLQENFPDGVFFVPLAGISAPDYIIPAIADAMGSSFSGSMEPELQLLNFLGQKKSLLILDNMEHLLDGVRVLTELLQRTDQVKLLATSREPLHRQAEWTFDVQGLPLPEGDRPDQLETSSAAMLFLQRAQQAHAGFTLSEDDRPAVLCICRQLQGLPLGIELAAAWVRALSCREIAEEIGRGIEFLESASRDLPGRHRSLMAVFDHSWELLSNKERAAFMRLSVFRGGFTRQAAQEVAGATLSMLSSLVDKSLVRRNAMGRYDLHDLARRYVQGHLIRSGDFDQARNQHLGFFLALVEEAKPGLYGPDQIPWLERLEQDHDNLRAALEWSLRYGGTVGKIPPDSYKETAQDALRLAGGLFQFWKRRDHWSEGRKWLERALAQSAGFPGTPERAEALNAAVLLAAEQTETGPARELAGENLALSHELDDPYSIARALNSFGFLLWKEKNFAEARSHCDRALTLFRELGDRFAVAESLHFLGHITINHGDLEAARAYLTESLSISEELGSTIGYIEVLGDLGLLAYLQDDYATAQFYLEDCLRRFREAGIVHGIESALNRLGDLARCQGDYERAGQLYEESLRLYREFHDKDETASLLHNLGYVAQHRGDYARALALFKEGLDIQYALYNQAGIAECLMGIAAVLSVRGQAEQAAQLCGAAEALRERVGASLWPANRIEYDRILGRLHSLLSEGAFAAAWAEGRAMSIEQAIIEANQ
ncbi:MAG TPA: tetratricopeptide repeat protein, partial [Anaerolineales bacterium]|nr:tetratricopeptide repeat protein [Anaerolineales bacterium]